VDAALLLGRPAVARAAAGRWNVDARDDAAADVWTLTMVTAAAQEHSGGGL